MKLPQIRTQTDEDTFKRVDRFSSDFNGIDPVSGRPFSCGLPDGLWIVAICYTIVVLGVIVASALKHLMSAGGQEQTLWFLPALGAAILLLPAIFLMFARSSGAVYWQGLLTLLSVVGAAFAIRQAVLAETFSIVGMVPALIAVALQLWVTAYVLKLRREGILE